MVHERHQDNLRDLIAELIETGDSQSAVALLVLRHEADQASLLQHLEVGSAREIVSALTPEQLGPVLPFLEEDVRSRLLEEMPAADLAPVLDEVSVDVAADIVQELPSEQAKEVVGLIDEQDAISEILSYGPRSAGGRMSATFVAVRREWTVGQATDLLRSQIADPDQPFYVYVTNEDERLLGEVSIRRLITATSDTLIEAIMSPEVISVGVDEDQETAAERLRHYKLLALPVLDEDGHLRGVFTAESVLEVQVEEATEDMFRLAGLAERDRLFRPLAEVVPPRLIWLVINLATTFLAAASVSIFEGTIEQVAVLAVFMPVIAGMGGNAGIQTVTLVVRALALDEVRLRDSARIVRYETLVALIIGLVTGLIVALVAWLWKGDSWLSLILLVSVLANMLIAMMVGAVIPLLLKYFRADPAMAAGVLVTTFSDVVGFVIFLGLAALLLSKLT